LGHERFGHQHVTRLHFVVEGQTEKAFVESLIKPHLASKGVYATVQVTITRVSETYNDGRRSRTQHQGGLLKYSIFRNHVHQRYVSDRNAYVTTLIDLYALPQDFPGMDTATNLPLSKRLEHLTEAMRKDLQADGRLIPYIQPHEFEALLFSDPNAINNVVSDAGLGRDPSRLNELKQIFNDFDSPEEINDSPMTAPSKRLLNLFPGYEKVVFGELIAGQIGLEMIRKRCPHFDAWVANLEQLGSQT
jgi:Domain of unknown function (DUF4276)